MALELQVLNMTSWPSPQNPWKERTVFAKPKKMGSVDARWKLNPCHMHTFGLTETYFILLEQPLTIDVKAMVANTIRDKPFIGGMEWMENKLVKIHLVNRETGKEVKTKVKCEAFFYMHIINCYERENHVVIDVNGYKKPELLHAFHLKNLREKGSTLGTELEGGTVKRIVIPMDMNDKVAPEMNLVMLASTKAKANRQKDGSLLLTPDNVTDFAYEIPSLNPNYIGKRHRYFYGSSGDMTGTTGKERWAKWTWTPVRQRSGLKMVSMLVLPPLSRSLVLQLKTME